MYHLQCMLLFQQNKQNSSIDVYMQALPLFFAIMLLLLLLRFAILFEQNKLCCTNLDMQVASENKS